MDVMHEKYFGSAQMQVKGQFDTQDFHILQRNKLMEESCFYLQEKSYCLLVHWKCCSSIFLFCCKIQLSE